jgi:hypothetical protein
VKWRGSVIRVSARRVFHRKRASHRHETAAAVANEDPVVRSVQFFGRYRHVRDGESSLDYRVRNFGFDCFAGGELCGLDLGEKVHGLEKMM